jgi:chorismate-pyruvate lyase
MQWPVWIKVATVLASIALLGSAPAPAQTVLWPDDFVSRIEALALVQTLNAEILASRSASAVLEKWCREHRLAGSEEAKVIAHLIRDATKPVAPEQRQRLAVGPSEEVKFRQVELRCGDHVLMEADNWYVPSRLTPEMNRILETTDTPFGKAVRHLEPYRLTFAVKVLWWPLPEGWERKPLPESSKARAMAIPNDLFEHWAVLYADRQPFSEVHEVYRRELLAFPLPRP